MRRAPRIEARDDLIAAAREHGVADHADLVVVRGARELRAAELGAVHRQPHELDITRGIEHRDDDAIAREPVRARDRELPGRRGRAKRDRLRAAIEPHPHAPVVEIVDRRGRVGVLRDGEHRDRAAVG